MNEVERTLTVPAAPSRVWDEIVNGAWLGDAVDLQPVVGTDGLVTDGDEIRHLVVESVEPNQRLVFRWWALRPDGVGPATRVVVTLETLPANDDVDAVATQVVVVEAPLAAPVPLPPSGPLALAAL